MPKRTQEELAVLQELILSNLTNVRMIILYGSYARGKYVIWDETYDERGVTTYYQSDLDILVICDTRDENKAERHAREVIVPKYDTRMEGKRHPAPPNIIVETLFGLLTEQILAGLCFGQENSKNATDDNEPCRETASLLAARFISKLPELRRILATDVEAAYYGDPAATCFGEIISCYPAIRAISNYRIAHELLILGVPLIPRFITEMAHSETGIDIHPGAQIGHHFTIDHGPGVVIGATSIIG